MIYDLPNYVTPIAALPVAAVAATANGTPYDMNGFIGNVLFRVDAGNATAGTSPTLDLVFKQSSDNSNWSNANVAFTQITGATSQVVSVDAREVYRYGRIDRVIGGTNSPSFPVSVVGFSQKQYTQA
jgi:hypothetical protein